jgi:hypothetical protein
LEERRGNIGKILKNKLRDKRPENLRKGNRHKTDKKNRDQPKDQRSAKRSEVSRKSRD